MAGSDSEVAQCQSAKLVIFTMSHAGSIPAIPATGDADSKTDGVTTVLSSQTSARNVVAPLDNPDNPTKMDGEVKKDFALLLNADHFPVLPPLLYFAPSDRCLETRRPWPAGSGKNRL